MTAHVVIVHRSLRDGYAVVRLELLEFAEPSPNGPRLGWTNQSTADGDDLATSVVVTADGTAYVAGTVRGLLSGDRAPRVTQSQIAAYDPSGQLQLIWSPADQRALLDPLHGYRDQQDESGCGRRRCG